MSDVLSTEEVRLMVEKNEARQLSITEVVALARSHEQLRAERDAAHRDKLTAEQNEDGFRARFQEAHARMIDAEAERDGAISLANERLREKRAAARAGGCAADALREIAKMAGPGESGTGAAGWILTLQAPRIARDALAAFDRAVSGQTAEKEEA